jgi:diaminopimelate decarboxylase
LARGDVVAILDAGMYAEVFSNQFNGMPRPAGVLVSEGGSIELIRQAETAQDVFARHVIPPRLAKSTRE